MLFLQVSSVGVLTFMIPFLEYPHHFPIALNIPVIAPYWDAVDIRRSVQVLYRSSQDPGLLSEVDAMIGNAFGRYFNGTSLFISTWDRVEAFSHIVIPDDMVT